MTSTAKPNPFVRITQQNHRLLKAIQKDDFDGFISLDPTQNQAVTLIHAANECIVRYPQGSFPLHVAYPMVYTTMHLIRACEKRYGRVKVKAMGQSFRNLFRLWFYAGAPRCPGKVFVKKIFDGENQLLSAICEHNRGIEEAGASPIATIQQATEQLKSHITSETDRGIAAKAPKRVRKFGHEGNGMKGPKTRKMKEQKRIFDTFLKGHPEGPGHSRISRAHECWLQHPGWTKAAKASGEAKGYASHKSLAAAR